jgi:hypothetical protein
MLSTRLLVRLACTVAALTAMQLATPQFATLAYASPTDDEVRAARELYSQAVQDEDAERWEEARDKLKRVAKVKPTAGISYHVALCEEHLGHLATALALYLVAQEEATRTEAQDVLRLVGPQLTSLGPRVPHLTFQTEPTLRNPSVTLDGAAVASSHLDIPLPVDPGLHHIEASALGASARTRRSSSTRAMRRSFVCRWCHRPIRRARRRRRPGLRARSQLPRPPCPPGRLLHPLQSPASWRRPAPASSQASESEPSLRPAALTPTPSASAPR